MFKFIARLFKRQPKPLTVQLELFSKQDLVNCDTRYNYYLYTIDFVNGDYR